MNVSDLLTPERVRLQGSISSKKRALEVLGELLATATPEVSDARIFDALNNRERLGSTGLGHGAAIPHGRLSGVTEAIGAVLKLDDGIDYDAVDEQPVDLMFALLVPEESTDEHLRILSGLAELFGDEESIGRIRAARTPEALIEALDGRASSFAA